VDFISNNFPANFLAPIEMTRVDLNHYNLQAKSMI